MRREEILAVLRAVPFRPFLLRMSDGRTFEIRHPDLVLPTLSTVHVGLPGSTPDAADQVIILSLVHVVSIEYLQAIAGSNGSTGSNPS